MSHKFKFTGDYTNGRETVTIYGTTFYLREATTVEDAATAAQLLTHPEVEEVKSTAPAAKSKD